MQITDEQIQEVLEKYRQGLTYLSIDDGGSIDQRHRELVGYVGFVLHEDADVLFDLLARGAQRIQSTVDQMLFSLDVVDAALPDVGRTNSPIPTTRNLTLAQNALDDIHTAIMVGGATSLGKRTAVSTGINNYLEELKPSVSEGSTFRYPAVEAQRLVTAQLDALLYGWEDIVESYPSLLTITTAWLESRVAQNTAALIIERVQEELSRIIARAESVDPAGRADLGIDDFVHLILADDVLADLFVLVDPTLPKVTGDQLKAIGTATPATLTAAKSAPYHLLATETGLDLTADEVNNQVFTLPTASQAQIIAGNKADPNYVLAADTRAQISATLTGPYTTPVRQNNTDMVSAAGSQIFTSAAGTFLSTASVGDYLVMTGTLVLNAYVLAIIDNNTLLLDTAAGSSQTGITWSLYHDNRAYITTRNTLTVVPLSVGASVPFGTWQTELAAGLAGLATVTVAGGLVSIEESLLASGGVVSTIQTRFVHANNPMSLMGFPTAIVRGTDSSLRLTVLTDTTPPAGETIAMTAGSYTAAAMAAHINTLATATYWSADTDGDRVVIKSATPGPKGFIEVTERNTVLGYDVGNRSEGDILTAEALQRFLQDTSTIDLDFEYDPQVIVEAAGLSTAAASAVVTDTSKNFTTLGVLVGDVVFIYSGPNRGYYHVGAVGTTTLTLDTPEWDITTAQSASDLQYKVERNPLIITSRDTTLTSAILVNAATANTKLGLVAATEVRGKCSQLEILQNAVQQDPEELKLTDNDVVVSTSPPMTVDVIDVSTDRVDIDGEVDNDFLSSDFTIISKSAQSYNLFQSALSTWESTQKSRILGGGGTLSEVLSLVRRAVQTGTPTYIGDAEGELSVLRDVLENTVTGLGAALSFLAPTNKDETEDLVGTIEEEGRDRMLDLLYLGQYREALSTSPVTSGTVGYMVALMQKGVSLINTDEESAAYLVPLTEETTDE